MSTSISGGSEARAARLLLVALLAGCGKSGDGGGKTGGMTEGPAPSRAGEGSGGRAAGGLGGAGGVAGSSGAAAGVGGATAGVAGAAAGVGGAAGAGGTDAGNTAPAVDAAGDAIARDAGAADATPGTLRLESDGFLQRDGERIFPASACYPRDQSPPFRFVGVPATAKSLAFTFVDRSNGATKWVVWDIPPDTVILPANLSKTVHPSELPAASQRGSLGRTGYSGPGVAGPPLHTYDFTLFALDVAQLPGTDGASTVALRTTIIPRHLVAQSPIFTAKGQLGGSGE